VNLGCAIGPNREGLDFGAIDKQLTKTIVLALTPQTGADPHLQFLASVMRALDEDGRRRVLPCESCQEPWEASAGKSLG